MATFQHLDALMQSFVDGGLPSCSCQITVKGETIYENYFGYADVEKKTPLTADNLFRMASMSKIPLYTTMMMLYEQGRVMLSDPIGKYLPEWATSRKFVTGGGGEIRIVPTERPITVRDCMSMKCGLPYCNSKAPSPDPTMTAMQKAMEPLWERGYYSNREHVRAMAEVPLASEPGTRWLYGFSSELTAAVIEAICDKPIDDVFQEMLFDPLEMDNTRAHFFGDTRERMVKLYFLQPDGSHAEGVHELDLKHNPGKEFETGWARLFSNVNDFSKLMSMLACGGAYKGRQLLGRKTIDMMRSNGLDPLSQADYDLAGSYYETGYGYGFGVRTLLDRYQANCNATPGAFGWSGGFGTWCEADPAEQMSIVYMHNTQPIQADYHMRVRAAAYGCLK